MPYPPFIPRQRGINIACTETHVQNPQYPNHAWMGIVVSKLKYFAEKRADYILDCMINGDRRVYICSAVELEQHLMGLDTILEAGTPHYSFYINYQTGELHKSLGQPVFMTAQLLPEDAEYQLKAKRISHIPQIYKYVIHQALGRECTPQNRISDYDLLTPLIEELGDVNSPDLKNCVNELVVRGIFRKYGMAYKFSPHKWMTFEQFAPNGSRAGSIDGICVAYQELFRR